MANMKQDRNGVRTASDVERKYKMGMIEPTAEDVDELKNVTLVVDDYLSTTSTHSVQNRVITQNLNNKVAKETGKGLSSNDFTDEDKNSIHVHNNKSVLDELVAPKSYNLINYKVSDLIIETGSCVIKENRICINIVCNYSVQANIDTKLFNLPSECMPSEEKFFVLYGEDIDGNGYYGIGNVSVEGYLTVNFTNQVNSEKMSFVYDI